MKLLILDRDGVINEDSDAFIKNPDEWHPLPGAAAAIARLNKAGYRIAIATNQSGIARGLFDLDTLAAIHTKLHQAINEAGGRIDAIFFCPHAADANGDCRKPRPGMIFDILRRFGAEPQETAVVGDSLRDLQAAHAAGCRSILVLTGKGTRTLQAGNLPPGTAIRVDLGAIAAELAA